MGGMSGHLVSNECLHTSAAARRHSRSSYLTQFCNVRSDSSSPIQCLKLLHASCGTWGPKQAHQLQKRRQLEQCGQEAYHLTLLHWFHCCTDVDPVAPMPRLQQDCSSLSVGCMLCYCQPWGGNEGRLHGNY